MKIWNCFQKIFCTRGWLTIRKVFPFGDTFLFKAAIQILIPLQPA